MCTYILHVTHYPNSITRQLLLDRISFCREREHSDIQNSLKCSRYSRLSLCDEYSTFYSNQDIQTSTGATFITIRSHIVSVQKHMNVIAIPRYG